MLSGCLAAQEHVSSPTPPGALVTLPGPRVAGPDSSTPRRVSTARRELPPGRGDPVGVAVVGLGSWGANLLRVLAENPDAEVRWICDLDRDRLAKHHPRYPAARVTTRLERVLADPGVEAVLIAAPDDRYHELAARALRAGRHVFLEKLLAPSAELAEHLAKMAGERRRILLCGHTFELRAFTRAIRAGEEMRLRTALVRIVDAADQSLVQQGRVVSLDHEDATEQPAARPELVLV